MNVRSNKFFVALIVLAALQIISNARSQTEEERLQRAREEGRREAAEDVKHGRLKYHVGGLRAPWDELYVAMLREECNVGLVPDGCIINTEQFQHGQGYNEVAVPAIEEKYGKGILRQVEERAREELEKRRKKSAEQAEEKQ